MLVDIPVLSSQLITPEPFVCKNCPESPSLDGSVKVMSAVDAGPIRVTLFVPLSESSKNSKKPAPVAPFFNCAPALITGVVSVLLVQVSVVVLPT